MMKKLITITTVTIVAVVAVSMAGAAPIDSVNANYLTTVFTADGSGSGALSIDEVADIVVEYFDGSQYTYVGNAFDLDVSLVADNSSNGIADGLFQGGSLTIGGLFSATIAELRLTELYNYSGILAGVGELYITGGILLGDFGTLGEMVQITFSVPSGVDDFSQSFGNGISNITFRPAPEPATICILCLGTLLLRKRCKA